MLERLRSLNDRYDELGRLLSDPDVIADLEFLRKYSKERSDLEEIVGVYREYARVLDDTAAAKDMLNAGDDKDTKQFAKEELEKLESLARRLEDRIKRLLAPKDPNDDRNTIVEIRAGTGGEEAALFAADLFRMYSRYAEGRHWKIEPMSTSLTGTGGFKEIVFAVEGRGAYSRFKYESGVHRVQRVPQTESQGRIHTSAATVAVLPEAEDVDVEIKQEDIEVDVFRSSGPGGQSVNTTDSAVRLRHKPTGLVVTCQEERSQHKNKAKALKVLRARLLDLARTEQEEKTAEARRNQVSTGDRSAKIRTYNFPQNRVTDHRIGMTLHGIDEMMNGAIGGLIDALATHFEAEKIARSIE